MDIGDLLRYSMGSNISGSMGAAMIIGFLAAVAVLILFFPKSKRDSFAEGSAAQYLHDFLHFRKMWAFSLLKAFYVIFACITTLMGLVLLFQAPLAGILTLLPGNLFLRLIYEFMVVFFSIHENLSDINGKTPGRSQSDGYGNGAGVVTDSAYGVGVGAGVGMSDGSGVGMGASGYAPSQNSYSQPPVQQQSNVCRNCGAPMSPGEAFCTRCGFRVN